jgi:hypothetical protein
LLSLTWSLFANAAGLDFAVGPLRVGTFRLPDPTTGASTAPTTGINRDDCLGIGQGPGSDTRWQFRFATPTVTYQNLEVWARQDVDGAAGCSNFADRGLTGVAQTCFKVATFTAAQVNAGGTLEIPDVSLVAAEILRRKDIPSDNFATDKAARDLVCTPTASQEPITLYLSFLLTSDTGGTLAPDGTTPHELVYATHYDLAGPPGPTIALNAGDAKLDASWATSGAPTGVKGFEAYCVPIAGGDAGAETGGGSSCEAAALAAGLVAGKIPNPALRCGHQAPPASGQVSVDGLTNGTTYAVAVAALDSYDNAGVVANVVCGTPKAGAGASPDSSSGGCAYAPAGPSSAFAALAISALGLVTRARRRSSARR